MSTVLRVLLVEDDEDDVVLVRDQLAAWPEFDLMAVPCVVDAAAELAAGHVDCVLLDLNLPDAVGFEGLERLLDHPDSAAIVVLTGDIDGARGAAAVAAGAQDYLVKGRNDAGVLVRAIRYAIERRSSARLQQEYAVAQATEAENARLQRGLLPAPILRDDAISVATTYQPGRSRQLLGGDFFDVVQTTDGVLHALIGDVCGHGPDEAALGVRLRIAWRTLVLSGAASETLFVTLDRVLEYERDDDCIFITASQISISADRRTAVVQRAGHPPPILLDADGAAILEHCATGPMLGLTRQWTWPQTTIELPSAWTLLLYTDGLIEGYAKRPARGRLGTDGLLGVLRAIAMTPGAVGEPALRELVSEVTRRNDSPLVDDVAVLVLNRLDPVDAVTAAGPAERFGVTAGARAL